MRRRLREQRRMREALLLDLGALVFELQRQGRREPELLQAKAAELSAVDHEVRALATALDAGHTVLELVATGVAGSCGNCGSLLSTDARYCHACGAPAVPSLAPDRQDDGGPALSPARPQPPPAFPEASRPGAQPPGLSDSGQGTRGAIGGRDSAASKRPAAASRLERMRELVRRRNTHG
ncbi:MAG: hypothetical protein ACRDSN_10605 [Pseudonocardiaceae bacterium]